jgi:transposase-like protein
VEAVRLAERGKVPVAQVARELGLNETALRQWMGLCGKRAGANRMTPEERDILRKR